MPRHMCGSGAFLFAALAGFCQDTLGKFLFKDRFFGGSPASAASHCNTSHSQNLRLAAALDAATCGA